jgi:2-dehydropantoate 2-reductase
MQQPLGLTYVKRCRGGGGNVASMRIAVIGAGAVGSALGSLLWRAGEDVVLVGRAAHVAAIRAAGLSVEGVLGGFNATPRAQERLSARPDLALLTVKTQDVVAALRENRAHLEGVPIVVLQNGLRSEELAATVVPEAQLVSGVVVLHAQFLLAGHVVLMQSEGLLVGRLNGANDEVVERVRAVLARAVPTSVTSNIRGARWTKLIVNLNNALPALCDASFKEVYQDRFLRRLAVGLMREGIAVATRAGVRLESLPGTSVPLVRLAAYLPAALAGAVAARKAAGIETHWPLKGSTWQSVAREKPTEIEYLNGEIVRLGRELQVPTPLNERVVALVRRVAAERRYLGAREIEHAFRARATRSA